MRGQALKGKEFQTGHRKSDSLIVLGAGERPVRGEAVRVKGVRFSGGHDTHRGIAK